MEIEEEEVKWEAMEPEKDEPVLTLGLRRRRALDKLPKLRLWNPLREPPVDLSPIKHMFPELRPSWLDLFPTKHVRLASPRHWMQLSDIDLSNLEILPEIAGSFFYQAHDKILDSIAAFFSDLFHLKSVTLSDDDVRRLQPVLASRNNQPIPEFLMEKLPELASRNNQTIPEFLTEKLPELRSWNDQSLQELIANTILMEKLPYLASRNTQRPLPELQANDNRLENLAASVFSQDLLSMNDNDVNQHVVYTVEAEQLLDAGESSRPREISGWTLLMTNLILEIASAVFDQMGYAQIGMVLAFVALLLAAVDLIHMARKERIKRAAGMSPILPLFHPRSTYTSATRKPVGTIVEYFGLAGAVWQCVYSTVEYTYTRQKKDNPIKISLLPFIFLLCVVISKLLVDKSSVVNSS